MMEARGLVKLFGTTIEVAAERGPPQEGGGGGGEKDLSIEKPMVKINSKGQEPTNSKENSDSAASSIEMERAEVAPADGEKPEEKQDGKSIIQEKPLKKPTKILPCPRCHSLDTKFCYFNNYNVNQPRHFCKACQRYWTDGGTTRNMAVGAGRRKIKSSSQYRHMTLFSATMQGIPSTIPEPFNHPEQTSDGATLAFRRSPYKSREQGPGIDEKAVWNRGKEGLEGVDGFVMFPPNIADGLQNSCPNSTMESGNKQEPRIQGFQAYNLQAPSLDGFPFSSPWNPSHTFSASYLPVSFYLVNPYQNSGMSGSLEIPGLLPMPYTTPSTSCSTTPSGSGPAPVLGKHSRDGSIISKNRVMTSDDSYKTSQEKGIWVPKTPRIDDPSEADRSSIWTTMGNKAIAGDQLCCQGLFNTFHPKAETMNQKPEIFDVLRANPTALLRSLEFHENIQWRKDMMEPSRQS